MDIKKSRNFQRLEIGLASPKEIRRWAERYLPNGETVGEVTSWETVNYKTLKPEPNGLFCQKIFGPVLDYTCACGKKTNKVQVGFCPKCGVEKTTARVRRYRLGYIKLKQPIVHTLYASHKPSPLSLCLDWSNKRFQAVMYGTEFCHLSSNWSVFSSNLQIYATQKLKFPSSLRRQFYNSMPKIEESPDSSKTQFKYQKTRQKVAYRFTKLKAFSRLDYSQYYRKVSLTQSKIYQKSLAQIKGGQLFSNKNQSKKDLSHLKNFYKASKLDFGLNLYGIAYDMTWRQVEDFQEFLIYSWEQPFQYECIIPYYRFTTSSDKKKSRQIPRHRQYYPIQTGGWVLQKILSNFQLLSLQEQIKLQYTQIRYAILYIRDILNLIPKEDYSERLPLLKKLNRLKQYEKKCLRRLQYFRDFYITKTQPTWMILSYLPVLPPGLRPITSIRGELIVSDINSLYRKVLTRNKRLVTETSFKIFDTALSGSWASWCYNLRQVQESVDSLLKTGSTDSGKKTKSLLDTLKGKKGRFRQHLLGKRVDYSGRSVIVVGPHLNIHECGIPKKMAIELFQPFVIQKLRKKGIVFTTTAAKAIIAERKPIIWNILSEIMENHPVLLNRAPTLHRLGIQAFLPKLVEGKAILLHPLVCPAFNADFDGDQMAVHVPLSPAARAEALNLLWSRNHLLAPSSGQPLLLPTQDMVLGFYYLTISNEIHSKFLPQNKVYTPENNLNNLYFSNFSEIQRTYERKFITIHTPIWVKWDGGVQNLLSEQQAKMKDAPLETRLDLVGNIEFIFNDRCSFMNANLLKRSQYIRTTPGRVFMHQCIAFTN